MGKRTFRSQKSKHFVLRIIDHLFNHAARLEISGILKESRTNTIEKRLKDKMKQTEQSDETCLPAYISIIEFGKPKALFIKK